MENYREYLPELKTTTLFQDIDDEALIDLLETMRPPIIRRKAGETIGLRPDMAAFRVVLRGPVREPAPRRFKWDMPRFGEPGMMMGEIPSLSRFLDHIERPAKPFFTPKPLEHDLDMLEFSGEMLVKFYGEKVAAAQGVVLRNFLGILAQKVTDVRRELFLLRDGVDMYARSGVNP